ncbi:MAG: HD domain-containing protein [Clostridiales Family XIII bacterium]|jgi:(p)ppGpp synthase/HD superfamily hydrolase|nr:HD domain-containing protein [Clostridiales Family XIII bacterium]
MAEKAKYVGDMPLMKKAMAYAVKKHEGQIRKVSKLPYYVHLFDVCAIVRKYKESYRIDELCAAAVLHDTLEDTATTYEELSAEFGPLVAGLVHQLTNDPALIKSMGKQAYLNAKLEEMTSYALTIKLADMLSNVAENPSTASVKRIRAHYRYITSGDMMLRVTAAQMAILLEINRTLIELHRA